MKKRSRSYHSYYIDKKRNRKKRQNTILWYESIKFVFWGIALNSGFSPVWIEIATIEEKE